MHFFITPFSRTDCHKPCRRHQTPCVARWVCTHKPWAVSSPGTREWWLPNTPNEWGVAVPHFATFAYSNLHMQRLPPSIHSAESFYKMIRQPNKSGQPLHAADSLQLPPVCKKNTNVSYQWREQRLPQLYARVCRAITGKHCKALFRSTETSWSSEWDGNKLTKKKDLHPNKRNGSWEKKSEIMLTNWSPGLVWNTVPFLVCQRKQLK